MTMANYIKELVISEYYKKADWKKWATDKIYENKDNEKWIYKVRNADNAASLLNILEPICEEEQYYKYNNNQFSDAVIGFIYKRYLKGELTMEDMLKRTYEEVSSGDSLIDPEKFKNYLDMVENNKDLQQDRKFISSVHDFYEIYLEIADLVLDKVEQ